MLESKSTSSRWRYLNPLFWLRKMRPARTLKFTREGKYFVGITIGIGLAAINTGNNLLYLILGWLLSLIVASGILSNLSLHRIRVRRVPPGRVFANRPFLMEVSVHNNKKRLASFSIEIEDTVEGKPLDKRCYFLKVPAGKNQKTSYRHTFNRRGLYVFDGFRVATKFPFALFTKRRRISASGEVLVFPTITEMPPPKPRARNQGDSAQAKAGRSGEFFGLREYRHGDDRRSIHWRTSARSGRLLVREFEEESQRRATLILDNALPKKASFDEVWSLEEAINQVASLSVAYLKKNYAIRLVTRSGVVPFGFGELHIDRVLRELALLDTVESSKPFAAQVEAQSESLLVVPLLEGKVPADRPSGVSHVYEVGAA